MRQGPWLHMGARSDGKRAGGAPKTELNISFAAHVNSDDCLGGFFPVPPVGGFPPTWGRQAYSGHLPISDLHVHNNKRLPRYLTDKHADTTQTSTAVMHTSEMHSHVHTYENTTMHNMFYAHACACLYRHMSLPAYQQKHRYEHLRMCEDVCLQNTGAPRRSDRELRPSHAHKRLQSANSLQELCLCARGCSPRSPSHLGRPEANCARVATFRLRSPPSSTNGSIRRKGCADVLDSLLELPRHRARFYNPLGPSSGALLTHTDTTGARAVASSGEATGPAKPLTHRSPSRKTRTPATPPPPRQEAESPPAPRNRIVEHRAVPRPQRPRNPGTPSRRSRTTMP